MLLEDLVALEQFLHLGFLQQFLEQLLQCLVFLQQLLEDLHLQVQFVCLGGMSLRRLHMDKHLVLKLLQQVLRLLQPLGTSLQRSGSRPWAGSSTWRILLSHGGSTST